MQYVEVVLDEDRKEQIRKKNDEISKVSISITYSVFKRFVPEVLGTYMGSRANIDINEMMGFVKIV